MRGSGRESERRCNREDHLPRVVERRDSQAGGARARQRANDYERTGAQTTRAPPDLSLPAPPPPPQSQAMRPPTRSARTTTSLPSTSAAYILRRPSWIFGQPFETWVDRPYRSGWAGARRRGRGRAEGQRRHWQSGRGRRDRSEAAAGDPGGGGKSEGRRGRGDAGTNGRAREGCDRRRLTECSLHGPVLSLSTRCSASDHKSRAGPRSAAPSGPAGDAVGRTVESSVGSRSFCEAVGRFLDGRRSAGWTEDWSSWAEPK